MDIVKYEDYIQTSDFKIPKYTYYQQEGMKLVAGQLGIKDVDAWVEELLKDFLAYGYTEPTEPYTETIQESVPIKVNCGGCGGGQIR